LRQRLGEDLGDLVELEVLVELRPLMVAQGERLASKHHLAQDLLDLN
jgi:hypothetical protein